MTTKILPLAALAAVLSLTALTDAQARSWSGQGSLTSPRGTATYRGSGSCAGGTCSSQGTFTRPNGATYTRQGTTTCANGACNTTGKVTGPGGQTVTRSGSLTYTPN
jgi:hypothetical protein